MKQFEEEVAKEVGVNCAIVIQQLHYWTQKGMGRREGEIVFIYNTYEQWQSNFPFWSIITIKRLFYRLIELGLVVRKQSHSWDKTSHYGLNYAHPIVSKCYVPSYQNDTIDRINVSRSYNTYPNQNEQTKLTGVRTSASSNNNNGSKLNELETKGYKDYYDKAEKWLLAKSPEFQREVGRYVDHHINSPKVHHPQAFKMAVVVEIWKKYNDMPNHTDFEYIDMEGIKEVMTPVLKTVPRKSPKAGIDEEMQKLYLEGGLCQE